MNARCFSDYNETQASNSKDTTPRHESRSSFGAAVTEAPAPFANDAASSRIDQDGKVFRRVNGKSLTLPPFMRKTPWQKTSPFERNIKNPRPGIEGGYTEGNKKTLRMKLKEAEFATRMQENPYARMLAEPVREERFSQQRLPRTCLLNFEVIEDETASTGQEATQDDATSSLNFLPLSLMGEALPNSKAQHRFTTRERAAVAALNEDSAFTPRGPGSHMLARYDMLAWVSADSKQDRLPRVLSTRAANTLEQAGRSLRGARSKSGRVVWQPDMPELVLAAMRKVVRRLLAFMLTTKTSRADRPGIVAEVPQMHEGAASLALLDKVDGVACVLRLGNAAVPAERRAQQHAPPLVESQWEAREKGSFLGGLKQLPPYPDEVDARWPTLQYRNRRVMLYDLPSLLGGAEQVHKLLAGTVFERSEWVTLKGSLGTTQLLQWLFRLHGYLAHGKGK